MLLLESGVNIDGKGGPWVPLHAASRGGHKRLVELLLARGADVNATARGGGWTALHSASNHNRVEVARVLLEHGANPNLVAPDRARFEGAEATPLLLAIAKQEKEMVALLLEKGADANLADPETRRTPLIGAVWQDQKEVINLLLEHKAQVDQPGARAETPLIYAAMNNRLAAAKALLAHKARVDLADELGATALHYAAETAEPMVELLLAAGASPKAVTKAGETPLHFTAIAQASVGQANSRFSRVVLEGYQRQSLPVASMPKVWEELLAKGADLNAADEQGYTLLHYVCSTHQPPLEHIELLIKKGADPESQTKHGVAPFALDRQQQDKLERQFLFPRFAKRHAITLVDRSTSGYVHPQKMEPASEKAEPPTWETVYEKLGFGVGQFQNPGTRITVYRAEGEGHVKEAGFFQLAGTPVKTADVSKLQWGDVVVVNTGTLFPITGPGIPENRR